MPRENDVNNYLLAKFRCKHIIQSLLSVGTSYDTSQKVVTCLQVYIVFIRII